MKAVIFSTTLTVMLFIFSTNLCAQERVIRGMVTTFDSIPLLGAIVKAQSTKQEVLTDSLGNFAITCDSKDKLKVTAHGFYSQSVKLNDKTKFAAINLRLKPGEKGRTYAVGYGHVADEDKLNAVTSLNKNDFDFSRYNTIYDLIKGRCAGVQILNNKDIIIRGVNSINTQDASALVLVDGVPYNKDNLKSIQPAQVKSIDVIKDAGAAIYGTRGANGVILIETNRGNKK